MNHRSVVSSTDANPDSASPFWDQEMLQSVVHDLRTPMTVIKAHLHLLLDGAIGPLSRDQALILERSISPLEDLIQMTENLLQSLALKEGDIRLQPTALDATPLLAETVNFYQLIFKQRGMTIRHEGPLSPLPLTADPFWFKRMLNNLIWNAYKFTPDGGQVMVRAHPADGGVQIAVRDTGRGIPSQHLHNIFQKFGQVSHQDRHAGSGLGLWICQRVMEAHKGQIQVESTEGEGTCFSLWFPAECAA